jgi:hypothetical protein
MSFISLKSKVKTVLQGISAIQQVLDYPNQDFSGFPAVIVRTDGNTSQYETTTENDEIYSFSLFAYQDIAGGVFSQEKARNILEELCDTIRDTFDSNEFLSGVTLPSNRVMLGIKPTVSSIGEDESGKYCIAVIELAIRISKTI